MAPVAYQLLHLYRMDVDAAYIRIYPIQYPLSQEYVMKKKIEWKTDFKEALEQARKESKAVLFDFFNPG